MRSKNAFSICIPFQSELQQRHQTRPRFPLNSRYSSAKKKTPGCLLLISSIFFHYDVGNAESGHTPIHRSIYSILRQLEPVSLQQRFPDTSPDLDAALALCLKPLEITCVYRPPTADVAHVRRLVTLPEAASVKASAMYI